MFTPCAGAAGAGARGDLGDTVWGTLIKDRSPSNGKYVRQRLLLGHFLNLLVAGEWVCVWGGGGGVLQRLLLMVAALCLSQGEGLP
jgi:hypothetical protein